VTTAELTLFLSACPFGEMIRRSEALGDLIEDGSLQPLSNDGALEIVATAIALPMMPSATA
jgi:hypothetical protein